MSLVDRLRRQITAAREMTERYLSDFKSPADWTHQVHPKSNHALWFVGHMAVSDNFFLSLIAPERATKLEGFDELFGMGSQPGNDPAKYPPAEKVLAAMRERRSQTLEVLSSLSDADLARKLPAGAPEFLSDIGSVFEMLIWHEGMHAGQLSVVRRALGHGPVFTP